MARGLGGGGGGGGGGVGGAIGDEASSLLAGDTKNFGNGGLEGEGDGGDDLDDDSTTTSFLTLDCSSLLAINLCMSLNLVF